MTSKLVLVLAYTHALSHLSRPLQMAREIKKMGFKTIFAGESENTKYIRKEGFDVVSIFEPDPQVLFSNIRNGRLRFIDSKTLDRMIRSDLALFDSVKPAVVLTDGRFSAPMSCQVAGLPHAAIVNASSTAYRSIPYVPMAESFSAFGLLPEKVLNPINLLLEKFLFDASANFFARYSYKHKLKKMVTATNCLTGVDLTLLSDLPEFFPTRNLPSNYHYIGPITWKQRVPLPMPSWWPPKTNGKPLIYITMGSTGISGFFNAMRRLCLDSEMVSVVTTGGQVDGLTTVSGKFWVETVMDGDKVMRACDLVVCHGGNGTIYQALSHAKPIVGIPTLADQSFNMRRVEALEVGQTVAPVDFIKNPANLMKTVRQILSRKAEYEKKARVLQGRIREFSGGIEKGAELITRLTG